jgi:ribosomal protein S18 acetylase RimI-like enzyme
MKEMTTMNVHIRKAAPSDATIAVPLIIDAIGNIAEQMTGETEPKAVEKELIGLFKCEGNRHTYLNTVVAQIDGSVAGVMVLYSGKQAIALDANLVHWLRSKTGEQIDIPPEAHIDEFYIDTVCVHPDFRGQGMGTLLLEHAEKIAQEAGFDKLTLNVEEEKEAAIRLYERIGYRVTEPWTIYGGAFHHMVKRL